MKTISRLWHSLVCGCNRKAPAYAWEGWARLLFPLMSAAALAWFLVRVIPKPIRATYPCQRAAFPLASAFVLWLLGIKISFFALLNFRARARCLRAALADSSTIRLFVLAALAMATAAFYLQAQVGRKSFTPSEPPNSPMGTGRGIFPSRVVWMRDTNATPWKGTSGHWWDDTNGVNLSAVERMTSRSLQALAGATSDAEAWLKLFRYYNSTHGRGNTGYATNESIALKINCNNSYDGYSDVDNQINASPQSVRALLRQLVNQAGVPQGRIVVYEAVRVVPDCIYNPCHAEFPNVLWMDSQGNGSNGRQPVTWHDAAFSYSTNAYLGNSIPEAVYQATYLINCALLKGHWHAGVSLTAKNHLGTISGAPHNHTLVDSYLLSMGTYHPFVDLIGSRQLGGKTLLFMIDGLYGIQEVTDVVSSSTASWNNLFIGQWSASYLMSLDPVALDSVGLDFLTSEFGDSLAHGHTDNCDNFLHEAALANQPPSGINYRPDGTKLTSLGVHEHWNNPSTKQYSRNLGATNGIELVRLEASANPAVALINPPSGGVLSAGTNLTLHALVADGLAATRKVDFYRSGAPLGTVTNSPYTLVWADAPIGAWALTAVVTDVNNFAATSSVVNVTIQRSVVAGPPTISKVRVGQNAVTLTISTAAGHSYRVDSTDTLHPAVWTPLGSPQAATASSLTVTNAVNGLAQRFYRAVLVDN